MLYNIPQNFDIVVYVPMIALAHSAIGNTIINNTITMVVYVIIYRNIIGKECRLYGRNILEQRKFLMNFNYLKMGVVVEP